MNTTAKLSTFGIALTVLAVGAYVTGTAVGPIETAPPAPAPASEHAAMAPAPAPASQHGDAHTTGAVPGSDLPGGLASRRDGYTFVPTDSTLTPGTTENFTFRILGPDATPVTGFDVKHDKRMHLIVVRRDSSGFQHIHPEMAPDGTWSVPLRLGAAGSYRAFADFAPTGGAATTLGVDLSAPGQYTPVEHPESRLAQVDGYTVELAGELVPGKASLVTLTVSRNGVPVTDLQPYLGAFGHLVALRGGDLAYLHVHPNGTPGDGVTPAGPRIEFVAEVPSAGTYRAFLDFQHNGVVRTAEFTVRAGAGPAAGAPTHADPPGATHGH